MKEPKTSSELKHCFLKMCPDLASLKPCRVLSISNNSKTSFYVCIVNAAATNVAVFFASVPESLISLEAFLSDHNRKPCGISLSSEQSSSALHRYWIDGIKRPLDMDFCKKNLKKTQKKKKSIRPNSDAVYCTST